MPDKRNIVLITLDSLRANHCSFMGYHRDTTPTLDKMAKRGLVFENAIAPGPRTIPSMPQIFTGKLMYFLNTDPYIGERENVRRHLRLNETLPEKLKRLSYTTGAFCPNAYTSRYFGFNRGFDYFQDFLFAKGSHQKIFERMINGSKLFSYIRNIRNLILKQEAFRSWETYYNEILEWIDKTREPFFLWVFLLDTHLPWLTPRKFRRWSNLLDMYYYNWKMFRLLGKYDPNFSENGRKKLINLYDDSIYYVDNFIKRLWKDLEDKDPIIVIHSDHGEEFGERGYYGHYHPHMYEENIHVPFIIYNADLTGKVEKQVSLLKLPFIVLSLVNNSFSVKNILNSSEYIVAKDFDYPTGRHVMAIRINNWKYIVGQNKKDELYNLKDDPQEQNNLVDKYIKLAKNMKKILKALINREIEVKKIYKVSSKIKGSL